jgi:hypothetical protein
MKLERTRRKTSERAAASSDTLRWTLKLPAKARNRQLHAWQRRVWGGPPGRGLGGQFGRLQRTLRGARERGKCTQNL